MRWKGRDLQVATPRTPKKPTTKRKTTRKRTTTSRARKGERLLVTCAPIIGDSVMDGIAAELYGSMLYDDDGRYFQVVSVRIDGRKVYGTCKEMYEAAPYMFAPVP